jgi:hypothetical protein
MREVPCLKGRLLARRDQLLRTIRGSRSKSSARGLPPRLPPKRMSQRILNYDQTISELARFTSRLVYASITTRDDPADFVAVGEGTLMFGVILQSLHDALDLPPLPGEHTTLQVGEAWWINIPRGSFQEAVASDDRITVLLDRCRITLEARGVVPSL